MTREEAIEVYHGLLNAKIKEAFEVFAPELAESEDERIRKELIGQVEKSGHHPSDKARWLAWLEKQKEQKQTLDLPAGFYFIDKNGKKYYTDTLKCGNIKFIANQKEQEQPSDVDSKLTERLEEIAQKGLENAHSIDFTEQAENSKKILEKRDHWKPSKEQMKALHNFAYTNFFGDGDCDALRSLYEQLKKL